METLYPTLKDSDQDEREAINDDGFVYNRKKRRLDLTSFLAPPTDPVPDPSLVLKERRYRKRKALLQLKNNYLKEIALWEQLSKSLSSMQNQKPIDFQFGSGSGSGSGSGTVLELKDHQTPNVLSQLLLQVEAQEAIIRDFSQLCEVAESLCSVHEERTKQHFIDLPVWKSPRELMASLCED